MSNPDIKYFDGLYIDFKCGHRYWLVEADFNKHGKEFIAWINQIKCHECGQEGK